MKEVTPTGKGEKAARHIRIAARTLIQDFFERIGKQAEKELGRSVSNEEIDAAVNLLEDQVTLAGFDAMFDALEEGYETLRKGIENARD